MRVAILVAIMLAAIGCHGAVKAPAPVAIPIEHPENSKACNDIYYHVVALKVFELGIPVNDDGTFNEEGSRRLAYGIDQEFRRRGTASWFFNQCLKYNSAQLECMQKAASIPLLNVCQDLFAD